MHEKPDDHLPYIFRKKNCSKCGEEKLYSEFRAEKGPRPSSKCSICISNQQRAINKKRKGNDVATNVSYYGKTKSKSVII